MTMFVSLPETPGGASSRITDPNPDHPTDEHTPLRDRDILDSLSYLLVCILTWLNQQSLIKFIT